MSKKPGRNDPCPCGSRRKTKRCCGRKRAAPTGLDPGELPWTMGGSGGLGPWEVVDELSGFATPVSIDVSVVEHPPPLADAEHLLGAELRVFEVVEVIDGLGYRVVEIEDSPGEPIWVEDVEGSWIAAPGTLFAGRFRNDTSICMPEHADCPLCQAERDRRKRRALEARGM